MEHKIIIASYIISTFLTITRMNDIIEHPIASVGFSVLGGGCIGKFITMTSPENILPHIAGSILLLSFAGFIARKKGWISDFRKLPFTIPTNLLVSPNKCRVSFKVHEYLDNTGPTLMIEGPLDVPNILDALNNEAGLDPLVINQKKVIIDTLMASEYLNKMTGVFVHTADTGLVMVRRSDIENKHVMCIRID